MAARLRIFVKKRGSRRTGARWPGMLAEGLLLLGLFGLGAYGLYWLVVRVLLAEGAEHGWWPWLALVIPIALIIYAIIGLVMMVWENIASTERRAAAVRKATEWEIPVGQRGPARIALPAVPPFDAVIDSPGVRLAHRLPIDAASGWVSMTMAAVCLLWNTLVAIFVYRVLQTHLTDRPNWLLTWVMVPFVLAGLWTLAALARQVLLDIIIGTTRLEVSQHPLYAGGTFRAFVSQTGRLHVRWFQVQLVCDEQAVYQQGTDSRRASSRVHRSTLFSQRKFDIRPQQAFETEFDFTIPDSAMHSFVSAHNAVVWTLVVRGRMKRWGDFERRFPIYVYPVRIIEPAASLPYLLSARS
jgi:hypothetical protein